MELVHIYLHMLPLVAVAVGPIHLLLKMQECHMV
jgi:hypothetical protein